MSTKKPCPFCGEEHALAVVETSTYRWRAVICGECGAMGPEVRIKTYGEGTRAEWEDAATQEAFDEWNKRGGTVDAES